MWAGVAGDEPFLVVRAATADASTTYSWVAVILVEALVVLLATEAGVVVCLRWIVTLCEMNGEAKPGRRRRKPQRTPSLNFLRLLSP